jgi:pterin-4a-carbinolamine dehydratase
MTERITAGQFHAADGVEDWRVLYRVVSAHFRTDSFATGVALISEISRLVGAADHSPRIDLRDAGVTVTLATRDITLARQISAAATDLGIPADPSALQLVDITIDALVGADVLPFWRALLITTKSAKTTWPTRRGAAQESRSRPWTPRAHSATAYTSTSPSRTIRPRPGSPQPWPRAVTLSPTHTRRCGGSLPTPRATRHASLPGSAANRSQRSPKLKTQGDKMHASYLPNR